MGELNILLFGAGAIGTYIGSSLVLSGQGAVFFERKEAAQFLTENGMRLIVDGEERLIATPTVTDSLADALQKGPFDAAIIAVKSYDTPELVGQLKAYPGKLPPVLCLQNGVENEGVLADGLGEGGVIAGTLTSAIGKPGPGISVLERLRGIGIADGHAVSPRLVEGFNRANLNARFYPDAGSMKWSKLLTNLLANATSAILDLTPAQIYANKGLFEIESRQIHEALEVMRRMDYQVVDLPGTPVRMMALLMELIPSGIAMRLAQRFLGRGRGNKMPSFHIDLYSGRGESEVGYLNGAAARFGERFGVETPVNKILCETLQRLTDQKIPLDSFVHQPEKLINFIHRH